MLGVVCVLMQPPPPTASSSTAFINVTNQPAATGSLPFYFGSVSMLFFRSRCYSSKNRTVKRSCFLPRHPAKPPTSSADLRYPLLCSRPGNSSNGINRALIPPAVIGVTPNVYLKDGFRCVSPIDVVQRQLLHPLDFA